MVLLNLVFFLLNLVIWHSGEAGDSGEFDDSGKSGVSGGSGSSGESGINRLIEMWSGLLEALRACLTSSFAPFGRSGRVRRRRRTFTAVL